MFQNKVNSTYDFRNSMAVDRKRSRVLTDSRGLCTYDSMSKTGHRETFVHAVLNTKGPVAYLEGPDLGLTSLLLARNVSPDRLVPHNLSRKVAEEVENRFKDVTCMVRDICNTALNARGEEFSVVWFDMCGVDFGTFDVEDLVHCAEYKFFTLSCRQVICMDQQSVLCAHLSACGERILQTSLYTGVSGKAMNMIFVVSKRNCNKKAKLVNDNIRIGTIVRIPLSFWKDASFVQEYGFNVYDGGFLMGAVHSNVPNSDSLHRISFQVTGGASMLCSMKYHSSVVRAHAI